MSSKVTATMYGEKELYDAIENMETELIKALEEKTTEIAGIFQNSAKQILASKIRNESTGRLGESIRTQLSLSSDGSMTAVIGPDGSAVNDKGQPYHEWVEFGHYITHGAAVYKNKKIQNSTTWIPGYFYMTGAWEQNKDKVLKDMTANLQMTLKNYAQKNGKVEHKGTGQVLYG